MARLAVQALHVRIVGPAWPWRKGRCYGPHWVSFGPSLPRCSYQDEKSTGVNGRGYASSTGPGGHLVEKLVTVMGMRNPL